MTVFWRVHYDGDMDRDDMLKRERMIWPRGMAPADKKRLGKQMKVGNGIVLGRLRGSRGLVTAIGRITAIEPHDIRMYDIAVSWHAIEDTKVKPDRSGLNRWKKYPVFKFSAEPAERYGFAELLEQHLGE